jgi:hypothetical protein
MSASLHSKYISFFGQQFQLFVASPQGANGCRKLVMGFLPVATTAQRQHRLRLSGLSTAIWAGKSLPEKTWISECALGLRAVRRIS